jgi:hypothetical protein
MNKKTLAALALAMGIVAAPSAFADNDMVRGVDDKGGMRMEKKGFKEGRPEKMDDKMGNRGEHTGIVADQYLQSILGMTAEQFRAELQSGKSVKDIITAKGLNFETVMKQVRAKHESDMKAKLAADVASGKITQAQADQMLKQRVDAEMKQLTTMATALGTTVDKLKADLASGKKLDETLKSLGLTRVQAMQKIRDAHQAEMKAKLAADVTSGKITQTQADEMLKKMVANETARDTAVAAALGITIDELTAMTASGKTIEQIATEKGISPETVKKAITTEMKNMGKGEKKGIVQKIKGLFQKKSQ